MKKVFLSLLVLIVIVAGLTGAGYWGYRIGYNDGSAASGNMPAFGRPYQHMTPGQMPMYRFGGEFNRGFGFNQHPMMSGRYHNFGMGYGFFSPLHLLWNIAILALVVWFIYWLFTKSGWQITHKANSSNEEGN